MSDGRGGVLQCLEIREMSRNQENEKGVASKLEEIQKHMVS